MKSSEDFLTVTELNNFIKDVLNSGFPQPVWVCGEIQELRDKKHLYFTLSEKDLLSNAVQAKIGASIWANVRPRIESILQKAENGFSLKEDIEVKLLCKVDFYPPFGQVRLIVEGIDPTYTLGKIAQDKQRLIAQLKQKGILDKNKSLLLPLLPLNIGLITSYDSAAYHDFIDELKKSRYPFKVHLIDSIMQGKTSQESVANAINLLNKLTNIDVIVITRGGGSVTELSCFDSELIATTIAKSKLPIISGIGHEINTTITDLAAHTFAKTPTAVAGFLIGLINQYKDTISDKVNNLATLTLDNLVNQKRKIKDFALILQQDTTRLFNAQRLHLERNQEGLKRLPVSILKEAKVRNLNTVGYLKRTIQLRLESSKNKIRGIEKAINIADPINMVKKGFSISRDSNGKIIQSIKGLKPQASLYVQLRDGTLKTEVQEVLKNKI